MEAKISALCSSLTAVLTHAEDSSHALSDALSRRPIHLESAVSAFLQGLDRRVEAAGADLARLESMAFGTVSFEELLGHCGEALAITSRHADAIEARLVSFGYVPPEVESSEDEDEDEDVEKLPVVPGNECFGGASSVLRASREKIDDDDDLFENSMSLKNLGFSDACLATLSSQDSGLSGSAEILYKKPERYLKEFVAGVQKSVKDAEPESVLPLRETNGQGNDAQGMIKASKEDFENLPPYMKALASYEELQEAISKLNSYFGGDKAQGSVALKQDDVGEIGLGRKGRSYLLILLRMNQLAMETIDGSIFYNLRKNDS